MKKFLIITIIVLIIFPNSVYAHTVGQPPYFRINGQFSNFYPVYSSSTANFSIPQDIAPANYIVGQKITFEIDTQALAVPPEIVKKTDFTWDFGDGKSASGLKNDHTYNKMGTYVLIIYADDKSTPKQIFETLALNVLPDANYKLPQAKIKVNGKGVSDPLTDIFRLDFSKEIEFKGDESQGSGKIIAYYWDFGDIKSSNEKNTKHSYAPDLTQVFPLLHVKDENGFIADSYVQIENQKLGQSQFAQPQNSTNSAPKKTGSSQLKFTLPALAALAILVFLIVKFKRKKAGK